MSVKTIERKVLEKNDQVASSNRDLFRERGIFVLNFVSSPGAGKTSILERTFQDLGKTMNMAVIEGDVQTDLDAQRVARYGVPVIQIVTLGGCHLDAILVRDAMKNLDLNGIDLLFIENVGNLVCPANYDLGEALKVVILSTTEGDDKPLKYPGMFLNSSVLIINKTDLIPYVKCNLDELKSSALRINPSLKVFEMSCFTGEGLPEWCDWLRKKGAVEK
ncbi:MAG: hydrogenase nickel incorporation protein HypB [Acidobacteria bacterium]|nr:hydrogenase nickel incorporation protein HypB [Acidobacteriota bacterium]